MGPPNPLATADAPDKLIRYLNTAMPLDDAQCLSCVWLPVCVGGCPNKRLYYGGRACLPYRDDPEKYVMALYERLQEQIRRKREGSEPEVVRGCHNRVYSPGISGTQMPLS